MLTPPSRNVRLLQPVQVLCCCSDGMRSHERSSGILIQLVCHPCFRQSGLSISDAAAENNRSFHSSSALSVAVFLRKNTLNTVTS
jgi:hypothetical protein